MQMYKKDDLINFEAKKDRFVGIDSDGCVFDSMGVKHKQHFIPMAIKTYGLEAIADEYRMASEFANLYSKWRGTNRFIALLKSFDLLNEMTAVKESGFALPNTDALRSYVNSGLALGNPTLAAEVEKTGNPDLKQALEWSNAVNKDIDENMEEIPPFEWARKALAKMAETSDLIVVSQTPECALVKEWKLHGIGDFVQVIAGQELGTKAEHLAMVKGDRYQSEKMLMIGDAPGDRLSAEAVGAWFFPINPGKEEASWKALFEEGYDRFLEDNFGGAYQAQLNEAFESLLPELPTWPTT